MTGREGKDTIKRGGWAKNGQLVSGQPLPQLSLQTGSFPRAWNYTILFGVIPPIAVPVTAGSPPVTQLVVPNYYAEALIRWSVAGSTVSRRVTVANGVEITCPAEAVVIDVMDMTTLFNLAGSGQPYNVDILVTPGTRGSFLIPPTLKAFGSTSGLAPFQGGTVLLVPGEIFVYPVPQDAGVVSAEVTFAGTSPSINNIQVTETDGVSINKVYYPANEEGFVTLGAGCTFLYVKNQDPTNTIAVTVTWGIDG